MSLPPAAADDCKTLPEVIAERREAHPSHFLLKIQSVSLLLNGTDQKYESMKFKAGGYNWRLIVYLNGSTEGKGGDYVCVNLVVVDTSSLPTDWEFNAIVRIFLFDQIRNNYVSIGGSPRRFHAMKPEWGITKFISRSSLKEPSNGYLMNDNCVFGAEVFVTKSERVIECLSMRRAKELKEFKVSEFSKLGFVWTSEEFVCCDHKWRINLYPKGVQGTKDCVSLYLHCVNCESSTHDKKIKADYTICIKNQIKNKHIKCYGSYWFTSHAPSTGCLFILNGPANKGFTVNDICIVEVEISAKVKRCVPES